MEFLNGERERKIFVCNIRESIMHEYEVRVYTCNTAYEHEVHAFVMAIDGCLPVISKQEVDGNEKIYWKIW